jgi:hypothetical protein
MMLGLQGTIGNAGRTSLVEQACPCGAPFASYMQRALQITGFSGNRDRSKQGSQNGHQTLVVGSVFQLFNPKHS